MDGLRVALWKIKRIIARKERIVSITDKDIGKTIFRINGKYYTMHAMTVDIRSWNGSKAELMFREILMPPEHPNCKCELSWVTDHSGGDKK